MQKQFDLESIQILEAGPEAMVIEREGGRGLAGGGAQAEADEPMRHLRCGTSAMAPPKPGCMMYFGGG